VSTDDDELVQVLKNAGHHEAAAVVAAKAGAAREANPEEPVEDRRTAADLVREGWALRVEDARRDREGR